jgi:hypothetical protein
MTSHDFWAPLRTSPNVYLPAITRVRWAKRFAVGPYHAFLGTECESVGFFKYHHVLYVFKPDLERPYLVVASEYDPATGAPERPFFTIYFGGTHLNQGSSAEWVDQASFTAKALEAIREPLQLTEAPKELPLSAPSPTPNSLFGAA